MTTISEDVTDAGTIDHSSTSLTFVTVTDHGPPDITFTTKNDDVKSISTTGTTAVTDPVTDVTSHETVTESVTNVTSHETVTESVTNVTSHGTVTDYVTDVTSPPARSTVVENETSSSSTTTTTSRFLEHSSQSFTTEATRSSPVFTTPSSTHTVELSTAGIQKQCDHGATIGIVTGVSAGIVLLVLLASLICFSRLRHKWRTKVQLERRKTDIWSMATFNNTIINDNFTDYQLASPQPQSSRSTKSARKSSGISENSTRFFDPFSHNSPPNQFILDNASVRQNYTKRHELSVDDSTLRRNTYSAPDGFELSAEYFATRQESTSSNDYMFSSRDRSSTFTAGKKHKADRHVLLSHEELVEDDSAGKHLGAPYKSPAHSYYLTEL